MRKVDTSPASRLPKHIIHSISAACEVMGRNETYGRATAYLGTGRGWWVRDDHMHRTHGTKARLVLQDV